MHVTKYHEGFVWVDLDVLSPVASLHQRHDLWDFASYRPCIGINRLLVELQAGQRVIMISDRYLEKLPTGNSEEPQKETQVQWNFSSKQTLTQNKIKSLDINGFE